MQQPLIRPGDNRAAYSYTLQSTEERDEHEEPGDTPRGRESPVWQPGDTPNYKPTPLRWPFIGAVIAFLLVVILLVIVAERRMPNSDSDVQILGVNPNATQPVRFARAVFSNTSTVDIGVTTIDAPKSTSNLVSTTLSQSPESSSTTNERIRVLAQSVTETDTHPPTTPFIPTQPLSSSASASPLSTTLPKPPSFSISETTTRTLAVPISGSGSTQLNMQNAAITSSSTSTPSSRTISTLSSASSTASLPSGARLIPISTSVSKFTTSITVPVTTVTYTSTFTSTQTIAFTSDATFVTTILSTVTEVNPTTFYSHFTANGTQASMPVSTATRTYTSVITLTSSVTSVGGGVSTATTVGTFTGTSTITGVVIPSVGEVTITYYRTVFPPEQVPVTNPPGPVKVTGVEVIEGSAVDVVQTQGPVVVVVGPSNKVETQVVGPQVSTGVARVGGSVVTNIVVVTPSPGGPAQVVTTVGGTPVTVVNNQDPVTVVRVVDGVQRTIVETPPPQTVVSVQGGVATTIMAGQPITNTVVGNVGGTPVTRVFVTTPAGPPFQPVSYTIVRDAGGTLVTEVIVTTPTVAGQPLTLTAVDVVGGTPVTQVVVTTVNAAVARPVSFTITTNVGGTPTVITVTPPPTTTVETINGTPVTRVITPPVTSFTTTVGGTLTTQVVVTTPTGTEPITLTVVSTSGDSLSTFTTTIPPTTRLTTISGTVRTITSTPSVRTIRSTRPATTRTFTSTSTASNTGTPLPTVISSTRTYRWTEADIFVGTFLPPLLGVALVIPLRIIDLNAKLYQPFQSLTNPPTHSSPPSLTTHPLLQQYTGLHTLLTPLHLLLHTHQPIPFLTTLAVALASLSAPLAAEAVGLKLHGACWANTASAGCGPALGVSVAPAYVLVGVLVVVVALVVAVGVGVGRWVTGLWADPWCLAGVAALGGDAVVRGGLERGGEGVVRRVVGARRYGLGWFRGEGGAEEYGVVVVEEAGEGLRRGVVDVAGGEGEFQEDGPVVAGWGTRRQQLPFMALRYPWRISFILFQLAVLIFIIYYHAYYRGGIRDNGRLWLFLNSNHFGVRFVSAIIGVIIAFCWQSFFLSKPLYFHTALTPRPSLRTSFTYLLTSSQASA